jgi:hypothetical protein
MINLYSKGVFAAFDRIDEYSLINSIRLSIMEKYLIEYTTHDNESKEEIVEAASREAALESFFFSNSEHYRIDSITLIE